MPPEARFWLEATVIFLVVFGVPIGLAIYMIVKIIKLKIK